VDKPQTVAIDRKPENGCKLQSSACGKSGVMLQINLVKTAKEEINKNCMGQQ
jgi:hypothetical protein